MKRLMAYLVVGAILTVADGSLAVTARADSLAGFTFDGLVIGRTGLNNIRSRYGNMRCSRNENQSDIKHGVEAYVVVDVPNCDGILCEFLDGTLYKIGVIYNARRVNNLGGVDAMMSTITRRYGLSPTLSQATTTDGKDKTVCTWESPPDARRAEVTILPSAAILVVVNTSAEAKLQARRVKSVNLGF